MTFWWAMTVYRVQLVLNPDREAKDQFTNTWHIANRAGQTREDAVDNFVADLNTFYQAIDSTMGGFVNASVPHWRAYDISEDKPRVPFREGDLTALSSSGSSQAPTELAICLSYRGVYASGQSPRRRRGRIYLGPWSTSAIDATAAGRVAAATKTAIVDAADALQAAAAADPAYMWVVYSRVSDPAEEGVVGFWEVTQGWVDNAFDIQRRRGLSSSSRTTF